jgi:hypothetical protein
LKEPLKPPAPRAKKPPVWARCDYKFSDVVAIQAWAAGTANEDQQKRAFDWVLRQACILGEEPFLPDSDRETTLILGRNFAARQIVKLVQMPPAAMAKLQTAEK